MSPPRAFLLSLLAAPLAAGCFFGGNPNANGTFVTTGNGGQVTSGPAGSGGTGGSEDTTTKDIAQYDALQAQLEKNRTLFKPAGLDSLTSVNNTLFWQEFPTDSPTLHSFDTTTNTQLDYAFSIGGPCDYNFRASESLVVWADTNGGYYAYDSTKANTMVGTLMVPPPSSDVQWWAYAPDGNNVYYVTTDNKTTLWKWVPPASAPTMLFDLEDTGATIGEFDDFGVSGNTMVFITGGAVWSLDIAAKKSTPLGNPIEDLTGAEIDSDGVLFPTDTGAYFYSFSTMMLRDLAAAIDGAKYELNTTYSAIQQFDPTRAGIGRYQQNIVYQGSSGVFTFGLDTGVITPVLLDARDDSTVYTQVTVLANGVMFVKGLQSMEGDIGADGPVYRVNLMP